MVGHEKPGSERVGVFEKIFGWDGRWHADGKMNSIWVYIYTCRVKFRLLNIENCLLLFCTGVLYTRERRLSGSEQGPVLLHLKSASLYIMDKGNLWRDILKNVSFSPPVPCISHLTLPSIFVTHARKKVTRREAQGWCLRKKLCKTKTLKV